MRVKKGYYIEDFFGKSFSVLPPLHVHKTQKHTHTHTYKHTSLTQKKVGGLSVALSFTVGQGTSPGYLESLICLSLSESSTIKWNLTLV